LRIWLGLTPAQFYDPAKVAITPMGFCYPGKAASGDNPPRGKCAPRGHEGVMPSCQISRSPCSWDAMRSASGVRKARLTDTVKAWKDYLPSGWLPLPHPSQRNQPWLARNRWFEAELVPEIKAVVRSFGL
jgi:uracil-DNA glycosylase